MNQQKPRILMISGSGVPIICGVGDYTAILLQTLHRLYPEWDLNWICKRARWFYPPISSYQGLQLIRPIHNWNNFGINLTKALVQWLKPDLIHIQDQIHTYYETDATLRIAKSAKCPVVVTLHEFHSELPSYKYTVELAKIADVVITSDTRTSNRCQELTGRAPDFQGWSPANILPLDIKQVISPIKGRITTFGMISKAKYEQLSIVFEALKLLKEEGLDITWRIIGPFEPKNNPSHAEFRQQFDLPWVEFTGSLPTNDRRLDTLLKETEIMILPFSDGASPRRTSLQTAWAFGLPVITTPPPVNEELIQDGLNCLLVSEACVQSWKVAIKQVLTDDVLQKKLSSGSISTAEFFSWEKLAKLHHKIFSQLLNNY